MQRTVKLGHWRLWFSLRRVDNMRGMCSDLGNGDHILMWDFDNLTLHSVEAALSLVQASYGLPEIAILETRPGTSYIAYSFARLPWKNAIVIVADTPHVDWNFVRLSIQRGYMTLRLTPKEGRVPVLAKILPSEVESSATIADLTHSIKYETGRK